MKSLCLQSLLFLTFSLSIYAQRGRVQIQDGTLVTDRGTLLRGCYIYTDGGWPMTPVKEEIDSIKEYGLNTIHLYAENEGCQYPGEKEAEIDSLVKWTEDNSLYLILTVGWWDSPDIDWISAFWKKYASKYKDKTHVIFEICNEAFHWSAPYDPATLNMEKQMYDTIRHYAPETHIQFMSYSENINADSAIMDFKSLGKDIDWSNASIAAHGYGYSAETTREFIRELQDSGYAITITEIPVIRASDGAKVSYPNMPFIRVLEEEFVSYMHFITPEIVIGDPSRYKLKFESSEIRWSPDFGTWPANVNQIDYINPYTNITAGFFDEGSYSANCSYPFELFIDSNYIDNPYVAYYNLDFEDGPDTLLIESIYMHNTSKVEIHLDSINGTQIGSCELPASSYQNKIAYSCPVTNIQGVHSIYLVFKSNSFVRTLIKNILFVKPGTHSKQPPYNGNIHEIPGKIEAEEYDCGGENISYFDNTSLNETQWFRFDDVDIEPANDIEGGYNIGYIDEGEWLEYTISCDNTYMMDIQLRIACTDPGEKILIKLDNQILGRVTLPNTNGWQNWETVTLEDIIIPTGDNQILRLEFLASGFNFNWINFIEKDVIGIDEINNTKITFYPNPAKKYVIVKNAKNAFFEIYSLKGQVLIQKQLFDNVNTIDISNIPPGCYAVKISNKNEVFSDLLVIEGR